MEQWGITGLIGSGKSEARRYLESQGFPAIDADQVARLLQSKEHPENLEKLKTLFGDSVLFPNREVNRGVIRKKIGSDERVRKSYEAWIHPEIRKYNEEWALRHSAQGAKVVFIEGTRLVESGAVQRLQGLILVTCHPEIRRQRLKERGEMSPDDQERLAKTQDEELMKKHAQVIWENSGTVAEFHQQIDAFTQRFR
jgi:dephospho-CoA kinase